MKVLLVAMATRGGMVQYAAELAAALATTHKVAVVTASTEAFPLGVEVLRLGLSRGRMRGMPRAMVQLRRFVSAWKPDVAHVTAVNARNLALQAVLGRVPRVATVHDVHLHPGDETTMNRLAIWHHNRAADFWIVHGHHSRALLQAAGKPADRIAVVPLGALCRGAAAATPEPPRPTILFFGRIRAYKGLDVLLRAVRRLVGELPEVKLVIAGSGTLAPYRDLMAGLECEVINRFVADEEIPPLFARSTVLACPYVEASQSGVVPLAYEFGLPVVATAVGDLPEAIEDGETGVLVPAGDSERLADVLLKLLTDAALRRRLRAGGKRLLRSRLSWGEAARRTTEVYEAVLRAPGLADP